MSFLNIFSKKKTQKIEELKIIADNREKNSLLIPEILSLNFQIEFKQLPVADYIINNIAIERKTISDLKNSIINKRIFSQLLELKQYTNHILMIEGPQEEIYSPPLHENAIRGFLLAVALEYQTPIIFTQNAKDTASYLKILSKNKGKKETSIRPGKIIKTEKERAQFILEGFQNIGPTKAKALLEKFNSLNKIFNAEEKDLLPLLGKQTKTFKETLEKIHS